MSIFLGTTALQKAYLGASEIEKIYQGTTEIYTSLYNLGSESAIDSQSGSGETGSVSSTARFTFNANGTVTAVSGATSPYTNWNTVGGSHISYRIVSTTSIGPAGFTAPMSASNDGSIRVAMTSARAFIASASASAGDASHTDFQYYEESMDRTIEVWVWNAATGGKVIAKGTYRIAASAGFNYTGEPL
tara:strand:- start:117 stop:683 length:567 start_codon:yes stop_codon:yes gene_type:complete